MRHQHPRRGPARLTAISSLALVCVALVPSGSSAQGTLGIGVCGATTIRDEGLVVRDRDIQRSLDREYPDLDIEHPAHSQIGEAGLAVSAGLTLMRLGRFGLRSEAQYCRRSYALSVFGDLRSRVVIPGNPVSIVEIVREVSRISRHIDYLSVPLLLRVRLWEEPATTASGFDFAIDIAGGPTPIWKIGCDFSEERFNFGKSTEDFDDPFAVCGNVKPSDLTWTLGLDLTFGQVFMSTRLETVKNMMSRGSVDSNAVIVLVGWAW